MSTTAAWCNEDHPLGLFSIAFTSSQIARLLGCSNRTVREFLERGILRGEHQPNGRWRVSRAALVAFLVAACREAGIAPHGLVRGPNGESPLLTTERVAHLLQRQPRTIRMKADHGTLPAFKIGRAWFFWRDDIERSIARPRDANRAISLGGTRASRTRAERNLASDCGETRR
jgi:excisionase family DNA binding protein